MNILAMGITFYRAFAVYMTSVVVVLATSFTNDLKSRC